MAKRRTLKPATPSQLSTGTVSENFKLLTESVQPKRRTRTQKRSKIELLIEDAKTRSLSGDWSDANGLTFVGLFALCHRVVYGVMPAELQEAKAINVTARMARKCMHAHFEDDSAEVALFIKWAWEVEKRKNTWAMGQGFDRAPLTCFGQFSARLITQYKVRANQHGRRRR